jgi:hypothetical protein
VATNRAARLRENERQLSRVTLIACVHVLNASAASKTALAFLFGERTIFILPFAILRAVDNIHAEKAMETDPASILSFICIGSATGMAF